MLSQVVIIGRIVKEVEVEEKENKKYSNITVAVPRAYKNENGEYETDFIDCALWSAIAENVAEYCKKGDLVGIKGRLQTEIVEDNKITRVIAEKVTFLSSAKHEEDNENEK